MSSPRGLVVGGMGGIVVIVVAVADGERWRVGEDGSGDWGGDAKARGKKNARGLSRSLDRRGGFRTFKYILNDRRALLACGTYLSQKNQTRDKRKTRDSLISISDLL
jgi:hypothetical protein